MKRTHIVILSTFLIFSACASINITHIPGYENLTGVDFRPYAEKGFLITPHIYNGEYISVYMVNYVIMPEAKYMTFGQNADGKSETGEWIFLDLLTIEAAMDSIYSNCLRMGADALMDFSIEPNSKYYAFENPVTVTGIKITGVAIKKMD